MTENEIRVKIKGYKKTIFFFFFFKSQRHIISVASYIVPFFTEILFFTISKSELYDIDEVIDKGKIIASDNNAYYLKRKVPNS